MRKVILNLAVSLDGFIARKNDSVDWLDHLNTNGSDLGFTKFLDSCDTLIMGSKSYETTLKLGNGVWPFKGKKTFVFTRQNKRNIEDVVFTSNSPIDVVRKLKNETGKHIWLFGGGSFINTMREENLVDEYIITTIPLFIGNGIPLFKDVNVESKLELLSVEKTNNIVQTRYKVLK